MAAAGSGALGDCAGFDNGIVALSAGIIGFASLIASADDGAVDLVVVTPSGPRDATGFPACIAPSVVGSAGFEGSIVPPSVGAPGFISPLAADSGRGVGCCMVGTSLGCASIAARASRLCGGAVGFASRSTVPPPEGASEFAGWISRDAASAAGVGSLAIAASERGVPIVIGTNPPCEEAFGSDCRTCAASAGAAVCGCAAKMMGLNTAEPLAGEELIVLGAAGFGRSSFPGFVPLAWAVLLPWFALAGDGVFAGAPATGAGEDRCRDAWTGHRLGSPGPPA